jgi:hypothetical protein
VSAASVLVRRASDTVVFARRATDSSGAFRVGGLPPGGYRVEVRHVGYRMASRGGATITAAANDVDLGVITLTPIAVALAEVAVNAARPTVAVFPDRTVYSTHAMPVAAGDRATDVLRSIPELQVTVEGSVTLRGATPQIRVNGRPPPMQGEALDRYLQQLPAERIERVEVITNPSARYEADGLGGIVNIVLKRSTGLGVSGGVGADVGTRDQRSASGNVDVVMGRLSLSSNASASFSGGSARNADLRENLSASPPTYVRQEARSDNAGTFGNLNLSAELQTGRHGTLWADAGGGRNPSDVTALAAYTLLDELRVPTERYDRASETHLRGRFGSVGMGYRAANAASGREWVVELRQNVNVLGRVDESLKQWLAEDPLAIDRAPELTSDGRGHRQGGLSLETSLTRRWAGSGRLEAGYRGSVRTAGDDYRLSIDSSPAPGAESDTAGDFRQRERVDAVFLSASRRVGRVDVQAGVRGEQAETRRTLPRTSERFTSAYRNLFPSVTLATALGPSGQLSLAYARRVDRPWGAILNPDIPSLDPLNRQVGNPDLAPRYTHSVSLTATRTGRLGMLQLSPYYRRTTASWDQLRTVDTAGVSTLTWRNLATVSSFGVTVSGSVAPVGRVGGLLSVSAYREMRDARNLAGDLRADFSGSSTQLSVTSTVSVRATPGLSLEGFLTYLPARTLPQGRVSPLVFSTLGVRQQLPGRRGAVTLSVVDPFELQHFTFTTRDRTHVQLGSSTFSARRATLGFSYTFGHVSRRNGRHRSADGQPQSQAPYIR